VPQVGWPDVRPEQGVVAASVWVVDVAARELVSAAPGAHAAEVPDFLVQAAGAAVEPGALTRAAVDRSGAEQEQQAGGVALTGLALVDAERAQDAAVVAAPSAGGEPIAGAAGHLRLELVQADEPAVGRAPVDAAAVSWLPVDAAAVPHLPVD